MSTKEAAFTALLTVLLCLMCGRVGATLAADLICRDIAGKTAEMHDGKCYRRTEDGALVPVKAGVR